MLKRCSPLVGAFCLALLGLVGCSVGPKSPASAVPAGTPEPSVVESMELTLVTPAPTIVPTPTPTPAPTPFSFVWIPDTQLLAYHSPHILECMGKWIADHRDTENILAVLHTGDLVDNGFKQEQYVNVDRMLDQFEEDLLFFPIAGNHDLGVKRQSYDAYLKQDFLNAFPEEQKFDGGKILYQPLDIAGTELLLLGIGWSALECDGATEWLDDVMQRYSDRTCILLLHGYLKETAEVGSFGRDAQKLVIAKYPNIRLVLSGHSRGYARLAEEFDDDGDGIADRTVEALMLNIQGKEYYGSVRLMRFDPATRSIEVSTFSPYYDQPLMPIEEMGDLDFILENIF